MGQTIDNIHFTYKKPENFEIVRRPGSDFDLGRNNGICCSKSNRFIDASKTFIKSIQKQPNSARETNGQSKIISSSSRTEVI